MPVPANPDRRVFMQSSASLAAGALLLPVEALIAQDRSDTASDKAGRRPIVISSANGVNALPKAMTMLRAGHDPLDAVIAAVNIVEDDPNDDTVGYGGLPNEDGVVELDSSVMHGPTHKAGAVAALRNIKNPSKVARLVMQRTDHVLIVGEGALRFARAHGFKEEDLLTEKARAEWLKWKESHSDDDDWLSPEDADGTASALRRRWRHTYGTINCCAVTEGGDLAGVTTTSGLSYKIPGRVGDSPIIGAGLYVDNDVGAAGSTGRGEANLQNCSSFLVVEMMRPTAMGGAGLSPTDACLATLRRIVSHTEKRLLDANGRPKFDLKLYALAKDGRYGSASIWSTAKFAVHDEKGARTEDCAFLYPTEERTWK